VLVALAQKSGGVRLLFVRQKRVVVAIALVEDPHVGIVRPGVATVPGSLRVIAATVSATSASNAWVWPSRISNSTTSANILGLSCRSASQVGGVDIIGVSREKGYRSQMHPRCAPSGAGQRERRRG
jgi:hypothetical protein